MKIKDSITTLAIDTSCDETSVSVMRDFTVLSNLLPSQMEYHSKFGGVVPSLARLAHQERIDNVVKESMKRAGVQFEDIDLIAVTYGPGLAIALEIGINKAKELAEIYNKPLMIINHMEGHLLSSFALRKNRNEIFKIDLNKDVQFPTLGVLVSGGHTELILVREFGKYEKIGETLDDACGEAYDKCGRMLGLGYPAGPIITKFAKENRKNLEFSVIKKDTSNLAHIKNKITGKEYSLSIPMLNSGDLNFSYSGLKTAFSQLVNKFESEGNLTKEIVYDLASLFEFAALHQVCVKVEKAIKKYDLKEIWLGGGVVASPRVRSLIRELGKKYKIKVRHPFSNKLTGDNAAMIAVAANINYKIGNIQNIFEKDFTKIDREPTLDIENI